MSSSGQSELYLPYSSSEEDSDIDGFSGTLVSSGKKKKEKFVSYKPHDPPVVTNEPQTMVSDMSSEFSEWRDKILKIQDKNKKLKEKEEEKRKKECERTGRMWFKKNDHVPDSQIQRQREDPNNPLKFLDEVSPRIRAGIIANMESDNRTLEMDKKTSEAIVNWRATSLPEQPRSVPSLEEYDYTTSDLSLLQRFNVPGVLGIDLEFTKPKPCVPATIQMYSWDLGCLLLYMEVPRRPDLKIIKEIFQNPKILKIGFSFENDIKALKILGIYPVGMIDIQYIFKELFHLETNPSLSNMYEFFTGVSISKAERAALFEMRVNGRLPPNSRLYAIEDSHMHLRCYFEFLKKNYRELEGESLIQRKAFLLNRVNLYYSTWMVVKLLHLSPSVEPSDPQKIMYKAKDETFDSEMMINRYGLTPDQMLMAKDLDKYRESMYIRNGRLSKHDLIPNGLLINLCKSPPKERAEIEERIKAWREPNGTFQSRGKTFPKFDGPLHITSSMNGFNILKILSGESTVEQIINRICCRCHDRNCFMFSLCEGKRAFMGREVLRRKAEKIAESTGEKPSLNSFYTSGYKRTRNLKDRRRRQRRAAEKLAAEEAATAERMQNTPGYWKNFFPEKYGTNGPTGYSSPRKLV